MLRKQYRYYTYYRSTKCLLSKTKVTRIGYYEYENDDRVCANCCTEKNSSCVWTDTRLSSVHIHKTHGISIQRNVIEPVDKILDEKH